jgi:hypothetical protein
MGRVKEGAKSAVSWFLCLLGVFIMVFALYITFVQPIGWDRIERTLLFVIGAVLTVMVWFN